MKVVLFCGGAGMRLRGYVDDVPKPMVQIGTRPVLWHLMKYYAYFGHKDFILCLGYKGNCIKDYFLHYDESVSNDFVWSQGGKNIQYLNRDIDDWKITFVETGANSNIGERLKAVEPYLQGEEMCLAMHGHCQGQAASGRTESRQGALESLESGRELNSEEARSDHIWRMIRLTINGKHAQRLKILCLGSHPDDIEIGCGGTILRLAEQDPGSVVHWVG